MESPVSKTAYIDISGSTVSFVGHDRVQSSGCQASIFTKVMP